MIFNTVAANAYTSSKCFLTRFSRTGPGFQMWLIFINVYGDVWFGLVEADDATRRRLKQLPVQRRDSGSESAVT